MLIYKQISVIDHLSTGEHYRATRKVAGVSQGQLAMRLGISQQILCDFEKGRRSWSEIFSAQYLAALKTN